MRITWCWRIFPPPRHFRDVEGAPNPAEIGSVPTHWNPYRRHLNERTNERSVVEYPIEWAPDKVTGKEYDPEWVRNIRNRKIFCCISRANANILVG